MDLLRTSLFVFSTLIISACTQEPQPSAPLAQDSERQTQYGAVIGKTDQHETFAWLDIPFAAPPVGELRWREPQPPQPWSAPREANEFGNPCPQFGSILSGIGGDLGEVVGSEDCLSLNVWAPQTASPEKPLPVMVWIHGGGNSAGTANTYNGSHLASDQKVVYVGFNYRLGLLGSFAHKSLRNTSDNPKDASGNFAVLDMIAALTWVRNNIAEFGGDPNNVTIFGESAGGRNVYAMLASPLAKGLFHKAIIQSGSTHTTEMELAESLLKESGEGYSNSSNEVLAHMLIREQRIAEAQDLSRYLSDKSDIEIANYLRQQTPANLMAHIPAPAIGMFRAPQSLADGHVLPKQSLLELLAQPDQFNAVPVILGTNRDENKLFMAQDSRWVDNLLGFIPRIKDPEKYSRYASYFSEQWKILSVDEPAERLTAHMPQQVFAYRFDWDNTPSSWLADMPALLGAAHGMEISFIFGDFEGGLEIPFVNTEDNLQDRLKLSEAMMSYWGHFAHHGYPSNGGVSEFPNWNPWSDTNNLMILDGEKDGVRMANLKLSANYLKQRIAQDPAIKTQKERCQLYAQTFLAAFNANDFWNTDEYQNYGASGCSSYNPYQFRLTP